MPSAPQQTQAMNLIEQSASDPDVTAVSSLIRPDSTNLRNIRLEYTDHSKYRNTAKSALDSSNSQLKPKEGDDIFSDKRLAGEVTKFLREEAMPKR